MWSRRRSQSQPCGSLIFGELAFASLVVTAGLPRRSPADDQGIHERMTQGPSHEQAGSGPHRVEGQVSSTTGFHGLTWWPVLLTLLEPSLDATRPAAVRIYGSQSPYSTD
jgi:hypothetical protein